MKNINFILIGLALAVSACSLKPSLRGSFIDKRDHHEYKWVKLKNQIWMAQNLDFLSSNSWNYNDDTTNHLIYGRFYQCKIAKEVCPVGWHLPSDEEWKTLEIAAGMSKTDADHDKWRGAVSTNFTKNGSMEFNVLFIGMRKQGYFEKFGEEAQFWTSTQNNMPTFTRIFKLSDNRICRNLLGAVYGCNVRCLKNDTTTNDLIIQKTR
jgi:uncharacterized protein (TIGR02145 family)